MMAFHARNSKLGTLCQWLESAVRIGKSATGWRVLAGLKAYLSNDHESSG